MIEQWKEIVKPDGSSYSSPRIKGYFVSNFGRVASVNNSMKKRILKPQLSHGGYLQVGLYDNGKYLHKTVHRLVIGAFVGECPENKEVDHINRNPSDNRVENLRYVTSKENKANQKNYEHGRKKKPVKCIETGVFYSSTLEASEKTGLRSGHISRSCTKGYSVNGFHFTFA